MVISELLPSVIESGANDFEPEAAPSVTLSVDELVLRPMLTVAVLLIVWPMPPDRVPVTVKMRLLLLGRLAEGMGIPVGPCMSATVLLVVGQVAPLAAAQLRPVTARLATTGSLKNEACSVPPE